MNIYNVIKNIKNRIKDRGISNTTKELYYILHNKNELKKEIQNFNGIKKGNSFY